MPRSDAVGLAIHHDELGEVGLLLLGRDYGLMAMLCGGLDIIDAQIGRTGRVLDAAP